MKLNTNGVTRLVILTENYAIKFPRFDYGWRLFIEGVRSNLNERELWKIAQVPGNKINNVKSYLCPVIWTSWGAWIIVMPKCEPAKTPAEFAEIWITAFNVLYGIVGDIKDDNFGYLKGLPVMFDYGCTNIDYFEGQKDPTYD